MRVFLILVLLVVASPARAETLPMECQILPIHKAKDDVTYKPGVDVKGKPVVPADLNAPSPILPKTVVVPLSIDLAKRMKNNKVEGLDMDAPLGMLEIHPDGRVTYDGRDLSEQVHTSCGREAVPATAEVPKPAETAAPAAPKGNGQPAGDALESDAVEVSPVPAIPPKSEIIGGGESREEGYR